MTDCAIAGIEAMSRSADAIVLMHRSYPVEDSLPGSPLLRFADRRRGPLDEQPDGAGRDRHVRHIEDAGVQQSDMQVEEVGDVAAKSDAVDQIADASRKHERQR